MGRIIVPVTVTSLFEPGRELRFDAVVDTELADRRVVSGELRQPLKIQIDDFPPAAGEDMPPEEGGRYLPLIGYMTLEQSAELIALQKRLKRLLDPQDLLNPGKILP